MFRCMLLSLLVTLAGGACLPNAIPPSERKLLENSNGESYPFGVWIANYAASYAANVMVQVLIEEVFGFNTTSGLGPGTVSGFYGVGGCLNPNDNNDPQCGTEVPTKYHLNMEAWVNGYPLVWKNLQLEHLKTAPDDLGSMGYAGYAGSFLTEEVITTAHKTEGIALQYYKFWNASWYEPSKYTNTITDFNLSRWLKPCMNSDSVFMDDTTMRRHIQFTGDLDGLVLNTSNSRYYAKCQDGYFWRAPSCRGNASQCVPFVTGGSGWSIEEMMQKSVVLYMPLGLAVAAGWTEYTQIPFHYPKMQVYWWVPDPSFLELAPQMMQWAPLDKRGWANGYQVSQLGSIPIKKLVSRDLMVLAPNVRSFVSNIMISLKQMDEILLDQKNTSATWEDATCKWLLANEPVWRSWIPDESQCFPGFGLYDSVLKDFVDARENATNKIICQACASGTYSTPLSDNVGDTFICMPCPKGTSQPLGAASSCKPCKQGEYQGETGQKTCNRCPISTYQDEEGTEVCKACPAGTTTLGLQSVAASDCGCDQNSIDMDPTDAFWCQPCGEGLTCPSSSSLVDLKRGVSDLGEQYLPQIQRGYYSTVDSPTQVFRCSGLKPCPGGTPGSCTGGLIGTPCAKCQEGKTWTGENCEDCSGWRQVIWVFAIIMIFVFLILMYYLTSSKVTAKATVLFATTASIGMLVMSMQNLGLIGMMTVEWPADLKGLFSICQFLLLDIDSYGFSCVAGQNAVIRYLLSSMIFPVGVAWLGVGFLVSKLMPQKFQWAGPKVASCMGAFLQVGFSTMSATSLAPMMCYKHPSGARSVLKYPDILCGSADHTAMLVIGWLLLVFFVLGFVALCTFAVMMVPKWSSQRKDHFVAAARFLVFRFRLDSWWFGVPLLLRGPLLSLPVVFATDYPPIQIIAIAMILSAFLVMQMLAWPWKVPMLNLTDIIVSFCVTLLVTTSSLHLKVVEGPMAAFAEGISTAMLSCIGIALGIMVLMTSSALIYRSALGGKKELSIFNLGKTVSSQRLATKLKEMSVQLEAMNQAELAEQLSALAVFDMNKVTTCITLLATEVAPPADEAVTYKFNARINSSSFDPALKKEKKSKRSTSHSGQDLSASNPEAIEKVDPELGNQVASNEPVEQSSPGEAMKSSWI